MLKIIELSHGSKLHLIDRDIKQNLFGIKVNYGAAYDDKYIKNVYLPSGTAHFLEHAIFYKKEGHVGEKFFDLGAYANAITSYESTIFYTTANNYIVESISLLLRVVLEKPNLSTNDLENERQVIQNEIQQKKNSLLHDELKQLMSLMYKEENIINDVTGVSENIQKIENKELIHAFLCFYKPKNMTFYFMGNMKALDINLLKDLIENYIEKAASSYSYLNISMERNLRTPFRLTPTTPSVHSLRACGEYVLIAFRAEEGRTHFYEADFYGKLIGRILIKIIHEKYPDLEIMEYVSSFNFNYNAIISVWRNNGLGSTHYDFSFLFDVENQQLFSSDGVESEVRDMGKKMDILFDSVDLFFISYMEKNYCYETLYDYKKNIEKFCHMKFLEYYKKIINKHNFYGITNNSSVKLNYRRDTRAF